MATCVYKAIVLIKQIQLKIRNILLKKDVNPDFWTIFQVQAAKNKNQPDSAFIY